MRVRSCVCVCVRARARERLRGHVNQAAVFDAARYRAVATDALWDYVSGGMPCRARLSACTFHWDTVPRGIRAVPYAARGGNTAARVRTFKKSREPKRIVGYASRCGMALAGGGRLPRRRSCAPTRSRGCPQATALKRMAPARDPPSPPLPSLPQLCHSFVCVHACACVCASLCLSVWFGVPVRRWLCVWAWVCMHQWLWRRALARHVRRANGSGRTAERP